MQRFSAGFTVVLMLGCRSASENQSPTASVPEASVPAVLHDAVDRATRDRFRQPERIIAALGLLPGQGVADVGAGHGYLTFRLVDAVGKTGRVVATDIDDVALAALNAHRPARANLVVRKVAPDSPGLEPGSYDLVLLSEVDHAVPDRVDFLIRLRAALAPAGRIAVTNRRALRAPLVTAAERAGYTVANEITDLPVHFLLFLQPK